MASRSNPIGLSQNCAVLAGPKGSKTELGVHKLKFLVALLILSEHASLSLLLPFLIKNLAQVLVPKVPYFWTSFGQCVVSKVPLF